TGGISTIDTNGFGATWNGVLSGAGGLVKAGVGTLNLTAANTYTGGTAISGGTLQVGNGGTSGSIVGDVADNGTLAFNRSNASAFTGAISGTGGVTKLGAGVLTLSGSGTYAGATLVNAGTFQAGAANVFSPGSAFTIASGATLNLAGFDNSIGSLAGSGGVTLGSATLASGNDGTSTTFSGAIGGTGGLTKTGGGALSLTGASTYTGPTNINAGVLDVNGALASTVAVNSGGTLMGSGTIGGLNVVDGGIVAPGNSIGTLHVAGNVGFSAGSAYQVEVNAAGQSDLIAASGHATLAGGNVQLSGTPAVNLTYTILTAQGGVSGTFSNVLNPGFIFLSPMLEYTPDSVLLSLRQTRGFTSAAATPNQFNVAAALAALPMDSSLFQAIAAQVSTAGARQAFDALSGEIHASAQSAMVDDSRYFRQAMLGRLRQAGFENAAGPVSALGSGGPQQAYAEPERDFADRFDPAVAALAYADSARPALALKSLPAAAAPPDLAWWAQGVGAWGSIDGDGNAAGVSRNLDGFFTGVDQRFGANWRAGIAGGHTNSNVSNSAGFANIDTAQLGAYAGASYGPWNFRAGAAWGWSTLGTSRSIVFPGFSDIASAHYGASTAQVFEEVGYSMAVGAVAAEPFAGLAWVHLNTEGFNETGSTMAVLTGSGSEDDVGYSTLGARVATNYILPNEMVLAARASAAWQHAFGDVTPEAALAFEGTAANFTVAGAPLASDAALIETGLDLLMTPQATIGISYTGQIASGIQDHSVKGNLLVKF
ncbi:autotransporter domain-containing protein, partial [Bradyrhizobium sp. dw_78]|uniref:autotransporter outer membrane beta-barrel domain-containing protein n=1 Tax=Bradyrhizobium sp. dw_78 TaxID=2719793 RepID=UPI001BD6B8B5